MDGRDECQKEKLLALGCVNLRPARLLRRTDSGDSPGADFLARLLGWLGNLGSSRSGRLDAMNFVKLVL